MKYDLNAVRIAAHVYTTEAHIDALHAGLEDITRGNVIKAPVTAAADED